MFSNTSTKIYLTDIEVKQYIELNWGQYCYYKVDGQNLVEVYNYHTKIFEYMYGNILGNGDIHFIKQKEDLDIRKENDLYKNQIERD